MNQESWFQRNGAVFTGAVALIALLTYLHVTLGEIRTEFREELRNITNSLDRVETKIDEVSGYLKFSAYSEENDTPLADLK
ncbi:MAG: hypothetical protein F4Z03_02580 [Gemmatimonadetes bacterium]|nr:hypothetical protein [Gemmatimonadota bacterium]